MSCVANFSWIKLNSKMLDMFWGLSSLSYGSASLIFAHFQKRLAPDFLCFTVAIFLSAEVLRSLFISLIIYFLSDWK